LIETLVIALTGLVVVQFGLLWYRIGKTEQKLDDVCRQLERNGRQYQEGKHG
jgi:hypothetical protein